MDADDWLDAELIDTLRAVNRRLGRMESKLNRLLREEHQMADDLQVAFDELNAKVQEAVDADAAAAVELADLVALVQAIPVGTTVTAAMVSEITAKLNDATAAVTAATTDAATATDPPPAP